ncbi:MAG: CPBP family intramembrane metalloprotease [Arenibacter sp.]|nr:CPBP family intramembrane metalloprotease [Arenibacter sp.]
MKLLRKVWLFTKTPAYSPLDHTPYTLKLRITVALLKWGLLLGLCFGLFNTWFLGMLNIDLGPHAMDKLLKTYSTYALLFLSVVLAPIIEECLFRGPLVWFRNKTYFKYALYFSIVLFALVHLSNFELYGKVYYIAPLLVGPQLILGIILGYVRVRLGLSWSIGLHASYNAILVLPLLLSKLANIPLA